MSGLLSAQDISSVDKAESKTEPGNDFATEASAFIYISENTTVANLSEIKNVTVVTVDKNESSQSALSASKKLSDKKDQNAVLLVKKILVREIEERLKKNIPIKYQVGIGNNAVFYIYNELGSKVFSVPSGSNKDLKYKVLAIGRPLFHNYLIYEHKESLVKELQEFFYDISRENYFSRPPPAIPA